MACRQIWCREVHSSQLRDRATQETILLRELSVSFFPLAGHQTKRTLPYLLRTIALQAALLDSIFCTRLVKLHKNTRIVFGQQDSTIIWAKICNGILSRIPSQDPLFWVFDRPDEVETPTETDKTTLEDQTRCPNQHFAISVLQNKDTNLGDPGNVPPNDRS